MQFARGIFTVGEEDKAAPRRGVPRLLSAGTVMEIAIANALKREGIALERGAPAARAFAHTDIGLPKRPGPGRLYDRGDLTFMNVTPVGTAPQIFRLGPKFKDVVRQAALIILINPIVERVQQELERIASTGEQS